jgi:nitrite reductase/ring-hydroxylating ferredoxin subunit
VTELSWTIVCVSVALEEGRPRRFQTGGRDVLIARVAGAVLAVDNVCTHALACLHEGRVRGTRVICPPHGASFDLRTGGVLGKPASTPLQRYEAREVKGHVEVFLPAPEVP